MHHCLRWPSYLWMTAHMYGHLLPEEKRFSLGWSLHRLLQQYIAEDIKRCTLYVLHSHRFQTAQLEYNWLSQFLLPKIPGKVSAFSFVPFLSRIPFNSIKNTLIY